GKGGFLDLVGHKFGRLTPIKRDGTNYRGEHMWLCKCDCGGETRVKTHSLTAGGTRSCGCLLREYLDNGASGTHGMSGTRFYHIWENMIRRCTDPKDESYGRYVGRGITVCEEWFAFENFYRDMHEGYRDHL